MFGLKGFFVLHWRKLEFPGFWVMLHLAGGYSKSSYVGRFCYLNIPWLRINITLTFMSSSSNKFTHL